MRSRFDEQLALLNKEMIEMGALCEEVIALASKALTEADPELAQDRKSTRLNSSHNNQSRMPSSA